MLKRLEALAAQEPNGELAGILESFSQDYRLLHQRLNKISRISDGYQEQLRGLNRELQEANRKLSTAHSEVKILRGLIPICARCKRIRDDDGLWDQVETYLSQHSEAVFSHGVCPDCAKILFPKTGPAAQPAGQQDPAPMREETEVQDRLEALRRDPVVTAHPLMAELDWLAGKHMRLLRRFTKVSRISDKYQQELIEISFALKEASHTDYLTGLSNRREAMVRLKAELKRAERSKVPLCVILADLDRFKQVNDSSGHEAGDRLLHAIARTLRGLLREYDLCARWGGEEFLILLPGTDLADAGVVAEKVRGRVAALALEFDGDRLACTISMGLTSHRPGEDQGTLLRRADQAMYEAKRLGGDRVVLAAEPA